MLEKQSGQVKRIIYHHTADVTQGSQLRKTDAYHRSRSFPRSSLGYYVGYHYFIERDGKLIQTREDTEVGAHTKSWNYDSIGIGLAGDFSSQLPSQKQKQVFAQLVSVLMKNHNLGLRDIFSHRAFSLTACPGKNISKKWHTWIWLYYEILPFKNLLTWIDKKLSQPFE